MQVNDPAVQDMLRQAMVARIATVSRNGRPSVTSIYFIYQDGQIWLGTSDWTLAARDVKADPRVSVLMEAERNKQDRRLLRITGQATVQIDPTMWRVYQRRVAFKYILNPGGLRNYLTHLRQYRLMDRYHAQSAAKGKACIIAVTPEQAVFLDRD